jgi:hypothetical protein
MFRLRAPHTLASIRADAARSAVCKPRLCRMGLHVREQVGAVHVPLTDAVSAGLAVIASQDVSGLTRCRRCGAISTIPRP